MIKINSKIRYHDYNLKTFTSEFICAGARSSIIGLYRLLEEKGANIKNKDNDKILLSSNTQIVLFCTISGIRNKFGCIELKKHSWWNDFHNKKIKTNRPIYRTYNLPSQWSKVLKEGCLWEGKETLTTL